MWMYKITTGKKWEFTVVIQYVTYESAGKSSGSFKNLIVGRKNGSMPTIIVIKVSNASVKKSL